MTHGTDSTPNRKPAKPSDDFPLTPRADGRWMKKIHGKLRYFTGTAEEAFAKYEAYMLSLADDAGCRLQIRHLCEAFMVAKEAKLQSGELTARTFREYNMACDEVYKHFGRLRPLDELKRSDADSLRARITKGVGLKTQAGRIVRTRSIFLFGHDREMIARPFHKWLDTIKKQSLKKEQARRPPRMLTAAEIKKLIDGAATPLKAMILCGINLGWGNSDCSNIEAQWLDLDGGWHTFPRFKTGEPRRGKLWPQTVQAIREAIASRPRAKDPAHDQRVFLTRCGGLWVKSHRTDDAISKEFRKLAISLGVHRPGMSFYSLRHCFETIGGGCRDQVAVNLVMGHVDGTMAGEYRHGIENERLEHVSNHVHTWLYGKPPAEDDQQGLRVVG